jgi:hypothetical protein
MNGEIAQEVARLVADIDAGVPWRELEERLLNVGLAAGYKGRRLILDAQIARITEEHSLRPRTTPPAPTQARARGRERSAHQPSLSQKEGRVFAKHQR